MSERQGPVGLATTFFVVFIVGGVGQPRRHGTAPNKEALIYDVREAGTEAFSGNVVVVV